jgi:tripeptidyl-peptidase-1
VTAVSSFFEVVINGELQTMFGTTASTVVVSSMVSLLNFKRLKKGLKTVGFLNPSLYLYYEKKLNESDSFVNDVSSGVNNCVSGNTVCCSEGFFFF